MNNMTNKVDLAQPSVTPEANPKLVRNFRNNTEIESFFRFVHENDMRAEAKKIFEVIVAKMKSERSSRNRKKKKNLQ